MRFRERVARSTLWPMLRKEFIQLRRDRLTLAMMVGVPAIQLALFGYAIQTEVRHQPLVVLDLARFRVDTKPLTASRRSPTFVGAGDRVEG